MSGAIAKEGNERMKRVTLINTLICAAVALLLSSGSTAAQDNNKDDDNDSRHKTRSGRAAARRKIGLFSLSLSLQSILLSLH